MSSSSGPIISPALLAKTDKILFLTHLAIGDYSYMQTYFKAFHEAFPHIQIDLFVDDVRRSWKWWTWKHLQRYSLYDWLEAAPYFRRIYTETYSPPALKRMIAAAREERYPLIVSLCTLRPHLYAKIARAISAPATLVGVVNSASEVPRGLAGVVVRPETFVANEWHITDVYAYNFERLFGVVVQPSDRKPFIEIPALWHERAREKFKTWGIDAVQARGGRVVFLNAFAKTEKRSWPLSAVVQFINDVRRHAFWSDTHFVINAMPSQCAQVQAFLDQSRCANVHLFSAVENFFELPAMIAACDFVISVETSTMHLSCALGVPTLALMRRKTPEWAPYDRDLSRVVFAPGRGWVSDIPASEVAARANEFFPRMTTEQQKREVIKPC